MKPRETNWQEMNIVAKEYGLTGKNGDYKHKLGFDVDLSACAPNILAVGYQVARTLEEKIVLKETWEFKTN